MNAELNIKLRALEPEDIDLLLDWENDQNIWQLSNTIAPFSRYILQKYIEASHQDIYQAKQLRLMIDLIINPRQVETVGAIDLFDFDPFHKRAGIGILISNEKHQGKGIGTKALSTLIQYAFNTLHLHQLYCNISESNSRSLTLFKSAGFEIIGLKKDWLNRGTIYENEFLLQLINQ